jgi:catechol 2,3-dioxygenase-like lactoylglutathione lyase family enzyme
MPVRLTKDSIDLGIVTNNGVAMVAFYRDVLGFTEEPQTPFHAGGVIHRLRCGTSLIKLVVPDDSSPKGPEGGAITNVTGLRYWTMIVDNLREIVAECEAAGSKVVFPVTEIRLGVSIAIVEDPDTNLVEFVAL